MNYAKPKLYFFVSLVVFASCAPHQKIPADTLVIGIESEIKNLDMRSSNDANAWHVTSLITQTLVKAGDDLFPVPDLAESFEVKDEGRLYLFRIPTNLRFHDGTPLGCGDVLASFEQVQTKGKAMSAFKDAKFTCPDERTFTIRIAVARSSFLLEDVGAIVILPRRDSLSKETIKNPIGTGAFRFVERKNRDLVLERYEEYKSKIFDYRLPNFKKVIVRTIEDPTTRYLSLMGGDIDVLMNALSPARIQEAQKDPHIHVYRRDGTTYQYIGLNMKNEKLRDPRVRKALSLAIDRESIIRFKLKGFARPAAGLMPPPSFFYNPELKPHPYDPAQARRLLKEAKAENLVLEFKSSTDRDVQSIIAIIKEQWEAVGVKVNVRPYEFATFFSDIQKGNFEVFALRWTALSDPEHLNKVFHSAEFPPGKNRGFYKNPRVDELLVKARAERNMMRRRELYNEVQKITLEDSPYISLWYLDNVAVSSQKLVDFKLHPLGSWSTVVFAKKESK